MDGEKKPLFVNSHAQLLFQNEMQDLDPSRREKIYKQVCSKLKRVHLRTNLKTLQELSTKTEVIQTLHQSTSIEAPNSVDRLITTKLKDIQKEIQEAPLSSIVDCLTENESFFRDNDLHRNPKTQLPHHMVFETSCEGRSFELSIMFTSMTRNGSLVVIIRETTFMDQINAYKAQEKARSLALASVSHELRNPLNGCLTMLQCTQDSTTMPKDIREEYISPAINILKMMQSLVDDILDYSQIRENKFKVTYEDIDLRQVICDTLSIVHMQATNKGLLLKNDISDDVPSLIHSDPKRLSQILLNLLSNAIKFTKTGYILVTANVIENSNHLVQIAVEDTGIGLTTENQAKLFKEDYLKLDLGQDAHLNTNGCGLGLNIANKLAITLGRGPEDHIKVSSQAKCGACFSFVIESKPSKRSLASYQEQNRISRVPSRPALKIQTNSIGNGPLDVSSPLEYTEHIDEHLLPDERITSQPNQVSMPLCTDFSVAIGGRCLQAPLLDIMVVDDEPYNVVALCSLLKSLKHDVISAYSGEKALQLLESKWISDDRYKQDQKLKIIFLDNNMPEMNGPQTAQLIRKKLESRPEIQVTIIGLTGHINSDIHKLMLEAGMNEVFLKPITKDDLISLLSKYAMRV